MSVNEKMTALADEIRELSGTTTEKGVEDMTVDVTNANAEVTSQEGLIAQIKTALEGKIANSVNLEERTITENGEYTPMAGYVGFSKVTVDVSTGGGGSDTGDTRYVYFNNTTHMPFLINGFYVDSGSITAIPQSSQGYDAGIYIFVLHYGEESNEILRFSYDESWYDEDIEQEITENYSNLISFNFFETEYLGMSVGFMFETPSPDTVITLTMEEE